MHRLHWLAGRNPRRNKLLGVVLGYLSATLRGLLLAALVARADQPQIADPSFSVAQALSGPDLEGFERAWEPRALQFPDDHGPHPGFRTEWWYLSGHLEDGSGAHFGYQLTVFRIALRPRNIARGSDWGTNQVYMAHFALTDVGSLRHWAFERFSRGALGLAGASAQPFRVWLENWSMQSEQHELFPLRLRARNGDLAVDLRLTSRKPPVLQGDKGFSRKSAEAGNASYYYSFSRLDTHGTIERRRERRGVVGTSWMDREWSTSALSPEQMGWDWFALQFADGRDLMYYNLRRRDGSSSPYSRGTLVDAAGTAIPLSNRDVELQPLETWTSADSGVRYPIGWRISVPDQGLDTRVEALIADQEVDLSVRYWEGAVRSRSELGEGEPVTGYGYMELTGYGEQ